MPTSPPAEQRTRVDLCPGVLRPWPADDGLLIRLRLVGGRLPIAALTHLLDVSERFGDGQVYLTKRANLQIRGLPGDDGQLTPDAVEAIESTGLLPSRSHELVRNITVSPQTGYAGGRADLRGVAAQLDALLCGDPRLAALPGRFLFTLDDGHGDLLDRLTDTGQRGTDLGLVALSAVEAQLRVGQHWGEIVTVTDAAEHLAGLAGAFLIARGSGAQAPWHVRELTTPLCPPVPPDPRIPAHPGALPYGAVPGGNHLQVPDGALTPDLGRALVEATEPGGTVIITPWHGVFIPREPEATT